MRKAILHYYQQERQHQMETYGKGVALFINGVDQHQFTGGGAAYGFHAVAAYYSARRAIHSRETLKADIAAHKKRSKAAKRGWKKRKQLARN